MPKPRSGKVPKRVLRKVPAESGVPRKVPKKCSGVRSPVLVSTEEQTPEHFFGTFLGTPLSAGTFRSTLFGTFPDRGFGTSLDGRQARNPRAHPMRTHPKETQGECWHFSFCPMKQLFGRQPLLPKTLGFPLMIRMSSSP